jgi:protein-S-isoprenylcysteine O-methyltransferase Ste14
MANFAEKPNRIPWPPIVFGVSVAAALVLHFLWPLPWLAGPWRTILFAAGLLLIAIAIAIDVAAFKALREHRTTINPTGAATQLVASGPFRHSRNPIYLGNSLALFGGSLLGVAWLVPAVVIAVVLVHKLAIEREEKHLAARFGDAWTAYAARTPRWLWRF